LEEKGYIQMLPKKGDKRKKVIRPSTAKGGESPKPNLKKSLRELARGVKSGGITPRKKKRCCENILKKSAEKCQPRRKK